LGFGNLATQIAALDLIDGTGELQRFERGDEAFGAAALALGSLGIITSITLDVVPHYNIREETWAVGFDEALEVVPELLDTTERVKFWWLPYTGVIQIFTYTTTDEPAEPRSALSDRLDSFVNDVVFDRVLKAGNRAPRLTQTINRIIGKAYFGQVSRVDRWDKLLTLAMPPIHLENEYGVPVEHTVDVMRDVREFVLKRDLAVSFINEVRFVDADNLWLSGSYERQSCQFGAYTTDNRDCATFMNGVESIVCPLGARPHWGKGFNVDGDYLATVYPKWTDFRSVRATYDPDDVFANAFILETLGAHP
jgi:FAD/FMN-containing dehydrogenase